MRQTNINKSRLRPLDRLGYAIATGFGAGSAPVAPGTVGSAEGVVLFVIINSIINNTLLLTRVSALILFIGINVVLYAIGVWASNVAINVTETDDPSAVVIDEVSGQLIALTPLILQTSLAGILVAFALFRFFDIFKPYPIRKLERLNAGHGVMADDALAGVYAAVLTWLGIQWQLI